MSVIYRYRVELQWGAGSPGVNTFWANSIEEQMASTQQLQDFGTQLGAMYDGITDLFVPGFTADWDGTVDMLEVADAALLNRKGGLNGWRQNGMADVSNTNRASQAKMQYKTDRLRGRRFLNGGVFLGPINETTMDANGAIHFGAIGRFESAHDGLLDIAGGMRLAVYGQPTRPKGAPPGTPNNGDGVAGYVQSVSVMTLPAVLRRRRD